MAQSVYNVFGGPPILPEKDSPAQRNSFGQYDGIDAGDRVDVQDFALVAALSKLPHETGAAGESAG